jgi:hypothetical protein
MISLIAAGRLRHIGCICMDRDLGSRSVHSAAIAIRVGVPGGVCVERGCRLPPPICCVSHCTKIGFFHGLTIKAFRFKFGRSQAPEFIGSRVHNRSA